MENYNDYLAALDKMTNEPDLPKLQSMLNFLSELLNSLTLSIKANELNVDFDDDAIEYLFYSFFETRDMVENKDKLQLLVDKVSDLISKQSYRFN